MTPQKESMFTGKMRYPCKHCPKIFSRKFNIQRHVSLKHSTIKPSQDSSYKKELSTEKKGFDDEHFV